MEDSRLEALEQRVTVLEDLLQREITINQEQTEAIAQRQAELVSKQRENRRWIEVIGTAMLGFFGFCLVVLTGLRLEFGWGSFALPADLFQSGAIAAAVTGVSKYVLDRQRTAD